MSATRIAPTPSGYLHMGNLLNALLTSWIARAEGLKLHLRIDDADHSRYRPEYVDYIFKSLSALGIEWNFGPRNIQELESGFSQHLKRSVYWNCLQRGNPDNFFVCSCSRKELKRDLGQCSCREPLSHYLPGKNAVRYRPAEGSLRRACGRLNVEVPRELSLLVWSRDDFPLNIWCGLIDDYEAEITHVVRGNDLLQLTAWQLALAEDLGLSGFESCRFHHHSLIQNGQGQKLSKSTQKLRSAPLLPRVVDVLELFQHWQGLPAGYSLKMATLYSHWVEHYRLNRSVWWQ